MSAIANLIWLVIVFGGGVTVGIFLAACSSVHQMHLAEAAERKARALREATEMLVELSKEIGVLRAAAVAKTVTERVS